MGTIVPIDRKVPVTNTHSTTSSTRTTDPAGPVGTTPTHRTIWSETKSALKTTEFAVWLVVSIAVLIAAAVTDGGDDGQRFGADHAWLYVTVVTAAFIVSRGLAKAGVPREGREVDDRS